MDYSIIRILVSQDLLSQCSNVSCPHISFNIYTIVSGTHWYSQRIWGWEKNLYNRDNYHLLSAYCVLFNSHNTSYPPVIDKDTRGHSAEKEYTSYLRSCPIAADDSESKFFLTVVCTAPKPHWLVKMQQNCQYTIKAMSHQMKQQKNRCKNFRELISTWY